MKTIIVEPEECWDYFLENRNDLLINEHIIAENKEDYGIEICLGSKFDLPEFNVYLDDDLIYTDCISLEANAKEECADILSEIYNDYLDDVESTLGLLIAKDEEEDWEKMINQDSIMVQEQQIDDTLQEFLETICDGFVKKIFTPNEFEDIKDHFCEYVARKYKKKIYRPMYLEKSDGTEFFAEFPYESMIFDDPDNPIYKS